MRIISGKYKGRQLAGFKNPNVRPTSDRVKETIFNKLMGEIEERRVLDLFGGTGNLAIESLSRGASAVDCVENHRSSLKIIHTNLQKLGIQEGINVHAKDVFAYLKAYQGPPYDVIIADPPFTQKLAHEVMNHIADSQTWHPETTIVVEATIHERVDSSYKTLFQYDKRGFGDKTVFFFRPEATES